MKRLPVFTSLLVPTCVAGIALSSGICHGQKPETPRYTVVDLGTLPGGSFSQATFINDHGVISGVSDVKGGAQHAFFWYRGLLTDIHLPGLGGPDSGAFGINNQQQIVVQAETMTVDPNHENFCGYNTPYECRGYVWRDGAITPLQTLGGNNLAVGTINNRGEVTGTAENSTRDPECPTHVAANFTGPLVLDFEAVVWGPRPGEIRKLKLLPHDSVATAIWINDKGEAVGASGRCSNTLPPPFAGGPHAVLWDQSGEPHDLGTLGGTANEDNLVGNVALAVNNATVVTGASAIPGSAVSHAFVWTREKGMRDIGTLPGDTGSGGQGINDRGDVVGTSFTGSPLTGVSHAFVWHDGTMTNLNKLIPADSPLSLAVAFAINNDGEIAGFGFTGNGALHGFLAIPCGRAHEGCAWCDAQMPRPRSKADDMREHPEANFGQSRGVVFGSFRGAPSK